MFNIEVGKEYRIVPTRYNMDSKMCECVGIKGNKFIFRHEKLQFAIEKKKYYEIVSVNGEFQNPIVVNIIPQLPSRERERYARLMNVLDTDLEHCVSDLKFRVVRFKNTSQAYNNAYPEDFIDSLKVKELLFYSDFPRTGNQIRVPKVRKGIVPARTNTTEGHKQLSLNIDNDSMSIKDFFEANYESFTGQYKKRKTVLVRSLLSTYGEKVLKKPLSVKERTNLIAEFCNTAPIEKKNKRYIVSYDYEDYLESSCKKDIPKSVIKPKPEPVQDTENSNVEEISQAVSDIFTGIHKIIKIFKKRFFR